MHKRKKENKDLFLFNAKNLIFPQKKIKKKTKSINS